jgi:HEPN domain-containing protein
MDRAVAGWVPLAKRDMRSARVLLENDDPENALFLCQQAIEKALKAHVQMTTDETPPRIHHLLRLAKVAGVWRDLDAEAQNTLIQVNPYVTVARYTLENRSAGVLVSADRAQEPVRRSEEVVAWLLSRLT